MPRFSTPARSATAQLDSIVAYVEQARRPDDPRRLVDRPPRPDPGGAGRLVRRGHGAGRPLRRGGREAAPVRRLKDALLVGLMLLVGRGKAVEAARSRSCRPARPTARAERLVLVLLALASAAAIGVRRHLRGRPAVAPDPVPRPLARARALRRSPRAARRRPRLVVTEELEDAYPARTSTTTHRGDLERDRRPRAAAAFTRRGLLKLGAAGGGRGARPRAARAASLALGPVFSTATVHRDAVAPRPRGSSTTTAAARARTTSTRARSTPRSRRAPTASSSPLPLVVVRLDPARARPAARARATGRRTGSSPTRRSARTPAARSRSTGSRRSRRVEPGPALVCPCHYSTLRPGDRRHGPLRAGGAAAAAAAADDRPSGLPARGRHRSAARSARRGGASGRRRGEAHVIRGGRPLPRRAHRAPRRSCARRCATSSPTTGRSCSARSRSTASSCSSSTGHLPDAVLRSRAPRRPSTTAPTARCRACR